MGRPTRVQSVSTGRLGCRTRTKQSPLGFTQAQCPRPGEGQALCNSAPGACSSQALSRGWSKPRAPQSCGNLWRGLRWDHRHQKQLELLSLSLIIICKGGVSHTSQISALWLNTLSCARASKAARRLPLRSQSWKHLPATPNKTLMNQGSVTAEAGRELGTPWHGSKNSKK